MSGRSILRNGTASADFEIAHPFGSCRFETRRDGPVERVADPGAADAAPPLSTRE